MIPQGCGSTMNSMADPRDVNIGHNHLSFACLFTCSLVRLFACSLVRLLLMKNFSNIIDLNPFFFKPTTVVLLFSFTTRVMITAEIVGPENKEIVKNS